MSFQNPVFIPGPTNMPEAIRKACDMPTIDHRSPLFGQILHPARAGVQEVLKSESAEVFIFPSTGTGGWETALTNTLSAGDTVLAARNGMFSHRWIDMCLRHELNVKIVETPWGRGIPADRYAEILMADTSKLGLASTVFFAPVEIADHVILDRSEDPTPRKFIDQLRNRNLQVDEAPVQLTRCRLRRPARPRPPPLTDPRTQK